MEEDYNASFKKIRYQETDVFGLLEREPEAYGNGGSTCMALFIM
jgi:hypothetical protein